jgi:pimeloyl-ACP methyl ester carboxylesterase
MAVDRTRADIVSLIETELLRLPDGRSLEFARYGDPAGRPAIFFHGLVGSHHQASFADASARRHGLCLIAPNRPGVGRSSPARRRVIADCVPDIVSLANHLGLGTFAVIGVSGGAPYALACLACLPGRVRAGVLVSGMGPVADPSVLARMSPFTQRALTLARRFPWLVRAILRVRVTQIRADPERFLAGLIRRWSVTDRALFQAEEVRATLLADLEQVFLRGEPVEGLSQELCLYFRWGFRLGEVPPGARVMLWHGRQDVLVPPFMTAHAARHLPGAEATLLPGGHFMVIGHADELARRAAELLGRVE